MKVVLRVILFIIVLGIFLINSIGYATTATTYLTDFPKSLQLYPRDLISNTASVKITGNAGISVSQIILKVYRDDILIDTLSKTLSSSDNSFSFTKSIPAELHAYKFEIFELNRLGLQLVAMSENVVAGDVYIISGQSNAVSRSYGESGSSDENQFIRTYASYSNPLDDTWNLALSDCRYTAGCAGQWPVRFARNIVDKQRIPVAILNGAQHGKPSVFFQRNESNPANINTNYGNMLTRTRNAGVTNDIRALLHHQGESDTDNVVFYENTLSLYDDWVNDYPSLEQVYLHQIRIRGCGGPPEFAQSYSWFSRFRTPLLSLISTNGINGHNGCHYTYKEGYKSIGNNAYALSSSLLYDDQTNSSVQPNIELVDMPNPQTIRVKVTEGIDLMADPNFEHLFSLLDKNANQIIYYPFSLGFVSSNVITLQLAYPLPHINYGLGYWGQNAPPSVQPWVTNDKGIGLLSVYDFPIGFKVYLPIVVKRN